MAPENTHDSLGNRSDLARMKEPGEDASEISIGYEHSFINIVHDFLKRIEDAGSPA